MSNTGVLAPVDAVNPLPAGAQLLVIGGGYCGHRFATRLQELGTRVITTRRNPEAGSNALAFNSDDGTIPSAEALAGTTHVLVTAPPDREGQDPCLKALESQLRRLELQWVGYLSTTGVYGDRKGLWVNEDDEAPLESLLRRSAARRRCEEAWLSSGWPVQIFRLPGIYGPGRNPMGSLRRGESRLVHKQGQVFCRIHVDDIVGAITHCLALLAERRPALLNVVDAWPAPSSDVISYAAHLLGCSLPEFQPFEAIAGELSPMALSFWRDNRRVSNQRLTQGLGYGLKYPSFREGLRACLNEEQAQLG
ncbi:MAG: SDR family NAD(P)-dependent oxidoreductase [Synechococcus sp. MED-G71]|nr:MAG: SDR family NAD(P)-dependent oxidoreductase [Synechococcus sp. MED-G71]